MYSHLRELPIEGKQAVEEEQASIDDLSSLVMPVVNHPEVEEIGFSVSYLRMNSDPELYEVRRIWVRTNQDRGRTPSELSVDGVNHPSFGDLRDDRANPLITNIRSLKRALQNSRYREAVLDVFGTENIAVSKNGIVVKDDEYDPYSDTWE